MTGNWITGLPAMLYELWGRATDVRKRRSTSTPLFKSPGHPYSNPLALSDMLPVRIRLKVLDG